MSSLLTINLEDGLANKNYWYFFLVLIIQ